MAAYPHPAAIPYPFARGPHISRARCDDDRFGRRLRRRLRRDLARRVTVQAWGVDHETNDLLADTGILELDNISGAEMIKGAGIANLADNDFITNPGCGESLDVRHT